MAGESPLSFGATTSLSATSTTGNAALPTLNSNQIIVTNLGPDLAYIKFGADNTITATTAAYPLLPGTQAAFSINPTLLYLAAITASTTATIKMTAADGLLMGIGAASTGASGGVVDSVNLAQVAGTTTATGHGVSGAGVLRVELPTDGTGTIASITTSVVPGTAATNLGKAEDSVHTSGDVGVFALGVATDGSTALNAAGDYGVLGTDTAGNVRVVGSVASGATDGGNPVKVAGKYNATLPTLTDAQRGDIQITSSGAIIAAMGGVRTTGADGLTNSNIVFPVNSAAAGTNGAMTAANVSPLLFNGTTWDRIRSGGVTGMAGVNPQATTTGGASFLNIAAGQATTTVKSGVGTLYAIILNSAATATNTTTVYDNTAASGTVIARPAATTATVPTTLNYGPTGLAFATGLTIITATANGSDMTVVYK